MAEQHDEIESENPVLQPSPQGWHHLHGHLAETAGGEEQVRLLPVQGERKRDRHRDSSHVHRGAEQHRKVRTITYIIIDEILK